jgi:hypothetical protein
MGNSETGGLGMRIPILIEPIEGGRFRARAAEPFAACVDGDSVQDAAELLKLELQQKVRPGAMLSFVDVANGAAAAPQPDESVASTADDNWFFTELREAIDENRRREDEEEQRRWTDEGKGS